VELFDEGLAFRALPSHDAQSIAGILSTDVHGTGNVFGTTGKEWGFVSQSVVGLKLIDGKGEVHECEPSDDLFKAAIGGVGAVGIISEVVVQA
jgi:FAD/FMN-containing dehydrogenase